ncbi:hypothetical protein FB451DRAFT_1043923 [Mycena latifolia]|nr:hypothetical protein FB451DRAFT_1043923 [Mycena latifolia]
MPKKNSREDALELLRKYDTVILVDDSGSMTLPGSKKRLSRWDEAGAALATLAETAQQYDTDGIDIYFLQNKGELNVTSSSQVRSLFDNIKEFGQSTPTGRRLHQILKPRLAKLEAAHIELDGTPKEKNTGDTIKRVNIIVITDGGATDSPKDVIIDTGTRLRALKNLCMTQIGIQFVQVGNDPAATQALKELDDELHETEDIRDIVDTTPYSKLNPVTADGLIKVLLGGINRRIDEQKK